MDPLSLLVGFVVGAFTGAAGNYLGQRFTDHRYQQEAKKQENEEWNDLVRRFPNIIKEMKEDISKEEFKDVREFFIKSSKTTVCSDGGAFEYHTDIHSNLVAAIAHLEDIGLIQDITPGNCPKYRMTEQFHDMLRNA